LSEFFSSLEIKTFLTRKLFAEQSANLSAQSLSQRLRAQFNEKYINYTHLLKTDGDGFTTEETWIL